MGKDVHVIFYTIDLIEVTFFMIQYPPDIFKKLMPVISRHDGISVFCTEHNLIEYLGIRAHEFVFVEPRCGSGFICPTYAPDYIRSYLNLIPSGFSNNSEEI